MIPTLSLRISLISSLLMLSGCGLNIFSSPKSPVVIDDIESRVGTLAVSADRRVVLVRSPRLAIDRQPDLEGLLRREAVETERRQ